MTVRISALAALLMGMTFSMFAFQNCAPMNFNENPLNDGLQADGGTITPSTTSDPNGGSTQPAITTTSTGTSGGVSSGTSGGVSSGTGGGVSSGTGGGVSSGTSGGVSSGTSGGVSSGTSGGVSSGTSGGVSSGTSGGVSSGTSGGVSSGTSGGVSSGTSGGTGTGVSIGTSSVFSPDQCNYNENGCNGNEEDAPTAPTGKNGRGCNITGMDGGPKGNANGGADYFVAIKCKLVQSTTNKTTHQCMDSSSTTYDWTCGTLWARPTQNPSDSNASISNPGSLDPRCYQDPTTVDAGWAMFSGDY